MSTLPTRITESPASRDVVAPINARGCDARHTVPKSSQRKPDTELCLMQRGAERC